jgi:hypothetical protein
MAKRALFRLVFLLHVLFLFPAALWATTYHVGPGRTYTTLQQVVDLLQPGDLVEVDGNATYPGDVAFTQAGTARDPITIRGIRVQGHRPVISGGTNTVSFVTPWPYSGPGADHYIFEGFEVTGGSFRGIYHQADDLTVRDVAVHDCPAHGILGADQGSGSCTLEYVEVYRCGGGTQHHQIYMASDEVHHPGSTFRMAHCYVHDANGGNNVKSRAERNEIYYNWIEGAYYHELELIGPDGGDGGDSSLKREDSDVVGNVLWKRATAAGNDPSFFAVRVGGDGTGETNGRYRFVNNTFLCGGSAAFRIFDGIESIEMHNNVFASASGGVIKIVRTAEAVWSTGVELIAGSRNWVPSVAIDLPSEWTDTMTGADPGFEDAGGADLTPASGSPLIDAGNQSPSGPPGHPFPDPLFPPAMAPPQRAPQLPGTALPRPADGALDIGAYERSALLTCGAIAPGQASEGGDVLFQGQASAPSCPQLPSFGWDFGDGSPRASSQDATHAYAAPGSYTWVLTVTACDESCSRAGQIAVAQRPQISRMSKLGNPFRIKVIGGNLQPGVRVFIDGVEWTFIKWKKTAKITLKGGASLKAVVPKNTPTAFRFMNPDGGQISITWSY